MQKKQLKNMKLSAAIITLNEEQNLKKLCHLLKIWAGYNGFLTPRRELVDAAGHWYTNIPIKNRPKYRHLKIIRLKDIH